MANDKAEYHHSYEKSRESSEEPDNHDSGLKKSEEGLSPLRNNSVGKIPKLKGSYRHIETKQVEALQVAIAYACLSPNAVMIHFILTFSTGAAVMNSWKF